MTAADAQYRRLQRLARRTADQAQASWREAAARGRIRESWRPAIPALVGAVSAAQLQAAADGAAYAEQAVEATGAEPEPEGTVVPEALAGVASDGRDLSGLLYIPALLALARIARRMDVREALLSGQASLTRLVATLVTDAGRVATGVQLVADDAVTGYVRRVQLPACARCILLAGKRFRTNAGFRRHPRCDCLHIPVTRAQEGDPAYDPRALFDSLSGAEQDRVFTKAGARAIREEGADMGRVVNARRGMSTAGGRKTTATGPTSRGGEPRLMPEAIYQLAGSRAQARMLLWRHGYLRPVVRRY